MTIITHFKVGEVQYSTVHKYWKYCDTCHVKNIILHQNKCVTTIIPLMPKPNNPWELGQYHIYWCPGLLRRLDISGSCISILRPRQDGRHFADNIFTCIFFKENCCILIKFSLKYVRNGPIDNNSALVQIIAWRQSGDKPLSEPMMISLPTHICVTRPQLVKYAG